MFEYFNSCKSFVSEETRNRSATMVSTSSALCLFPGVKAFPLCTLSLIIKKIADVKKRMEMEFA